MWLPGSTVVEVCHPCCVCENWKGYVVTTHMDIHSPRSKTRVGWKHTHTRRIRKYYVYVFLKNSKNFQCIVTPDLFTTLLTHISVTVPPRSLLDLPATRPQSGGRKRNTPLHNTSAPRNFKLDTSHQTLSYL